MNTWNNGYITDSIYTSGYYNELSPQTIRFNLLMKGYTFPHDKDLTYMELGFGQGLSLIIHNASTSASCLGTDFNPSHALEAQYLADKAALDLKIFDHSFEELAKKNDLPPCDIIVLHGIWSWINEVNRNYILEIIQKNLKLGGVVYIGYNVYPGWAAFAPVRELMKLHSHSVHQATNNIHTSIPNALEFIESLTENTHYIHGNPSIGHHLSKMKSMSIDYLAHEYFNADWKACYFYEMASAMGKIKLDFLTSAHSLSNNDAMYVPSAFLPTFLNYPVDLRETTRDFVINQTFRKDLFIKGKHSLNVLEYKKALENLNFILLKQSQDFSYSVTTSLGTLSLNQELYKTFIEEIEKSPKAFISLKQIIENTHLKDAHISLLIDIMNTLVGMQVIAPVFNPEEISKNQKKCKKLNSNITQSALSKYQHMFLASPVTGTGIYADRFEMLIINALEKGFKTKIDISKAIYEQLKSINEHLEENNIQLSKERSLEVLENLAATFLEKKLSIFQNLGICS